MFCWLVRYFTPLPACSCQARTADPHSAEHQALEGWVEDAAGLQLVDRVVARAQPLVEFALASAATNLACFQAVAAA